MPDAALRYATFPSPVGELLVAGDGTAVHALGLAGGDRACLTAPAWRRDDAAMQPACDEILAWLAGERRDFAMPLRLDGTDFQQQVWNELLRIPFGATTTYGDLARRVGRPTAARAVGAAVGRNPVAIVVPCHRVVGRSGVLTGYRYGLEMKRRLLAIEGVGTLPLV